MIVRLFVALIFIGSFVQQGWSQQQTREGAALGGAAGAIIGGIIGHQNDETPEGAIIGGVVGAVTGGMIGNARDQQIRRDQYYQARLQDQQQQIQELNRRTVRMQDVISMTHSGLSDQVIINHVQTNGVERRLEVSEIIQMHQQGVSDQVITAMQTAPIANIRPTQTYAYPQIIDRRPAVIMHETYEVIPAPPPCYYPVPRQSYFYYHHHHHR